jgi:phospholipid transport system substrate-binding protein
MRTIVLGIVLAMAAPWAASAQTGDASAALAVRHQQLERALAMRAGDARQRALDRLLDEVLDYDAITSRALVVHWSTLTAEQRTEVSDLLRRAIRQTYQTSVESLRGFEVTVTSEEPHGPGVRVLSRAVRAGESRAIEYDLVRTSGRWRIVDLVVDGNSLIHQYRLQFNRAIRRYGWDGFIERLRERVESEPR